MKNGLYLLMFLLVACADEQGTLAKTEETKNDHGALRSETYDLDALAKEAVDSVYIKQQDSIATTRLSELYPLFCRLALGPKPKDYSEYVVLPLSAEVGGMDREGVVIETFDELRKRHSIVFSPKLADSRNDSLRVEVTKAGIGRYVIEFRILGAIPMNSIPKFVKDYQVFYNFSFVDNSFKLTGIRGVGGSIDLPTYQPPYVSAKKETTPSPSYR